MEHSKVWSDLARRASASEGAPPVIRGLLLFAALAIVLLATVGFLFSPRFAVFVGYLPLALLLLLGLALLRPVAGRPDVARLLGPLNAVLVAAYLVLGVLHAYVNARLYDGSQYDGAFQLFFPLRRMEQGQWPGRDFFYFHGQLIPVLVYPFYKLFGADFFAAQFAAKLVDLLVPLAYYGIFKWLGMPRGQALLATVALVGLLVTDRFTFGTQNPVDGIHIYALRSLLPLLYLAWLAGRMAVPGQAERLRRQFFVRQAPVQAGLFVLSFYLGSEQAFYLLAAMLLANLLLAGWRPVRIVLQSVWLVALAVGLLLLANLVLFGAQKPLTYLGEISRNQTWFYGGYPNEFLHGALDFSRYRSSAFKVSAKLVVCLLGLPALAWLVWRLRRDDRRLFFFVLLGGTYGLIGLSSLLASYAGEQYADNAIKVMLVGGIALAFRSTGRPAGRTRPGHLSGRLAFDLRAAAPLVLVLGVAACIYSLAFALSAPRNLRLLGLLDGPLFMHHPDLGVSLPYRPLRLKEDERYHASQFLALQQALGDASARVVYPEFSYADGFEGGVRNLFQIRVRGGAIPAALAPGDFCAMGDEAFRIADIDRASGQLSFERSTLGDGATRPAQIACYRRPAQDYVALDGKRLRLEQNIYDRYFHDGLYRGARLQLRLRSDADYPLRVGDGVTLAGRTYRIEAVYANGVLVLDAEAHPLPFAFDRGAAFAVTYRVAADNSFSYRLPILPAERAVTRVRLHDLAVLDEMAAQPEAVVAKTGEAATILRIDRARGSVDLDGTLSPHALSYGLHFGALRRADFDTVGEVPPVFQLMKGIVSAKRPDSTLRGSSIDFYFHTFSARLLEEYLDGLRRADPEFVSTPSGRYVNNFIWYDNWLVRARWPVFEHLLATYRPVAWSKFEIFWKKAEPYRQDAAWQSVPVGAGAAGTTLVLPTAGPVRDGDACRTTAYEVELDYAIEGWQRALPLLGSSTRHVAYIDDELGVPLTFNPNETRVRFPVVPLRGETRIALDRVAPFGIDTHLQVRSAHYRPLSLPADRLAALAGGPADSVCR